MNKPEHIPHLELEVKILEVDPADITQKLEAVGAKKFLTDLRLLKDLIFLQTKKFPLMQIMFQHDSVQSFRKLQLSLTDHEHLFLKELT